MSSNGLIIRTGGVALQKIYGIKSGLTLDVNQMPKVPTDEEVQPGDSAGSDVPGIVGVFRRKDSLGNILGGKLFGFVRHGHEGVRRERGFKERSDVFRGIGKFVEGDGRTEELPFASLHLPPKLSGWLLPFVVEIATENGSIEVKRRRSHSHDGIGSASCNASAIFDRIHRICRIYMNGGSRVGSLDSMNKIYEIWQMRNYMKFCNFVNYVKKSC